MPTQAPGNLIASRVAMLPGGIVAEVVLNERTEAFVRWFGGGSWSAWRPVAERVRDVSITPDISQQDPAALVGIVVFVPLPMGAIAPLHVSHKSEFYRLTASGIAPADDL